MIAGARGREHAAEAAGYLEGAIISRALSADIRAMPDDALYLAPPVGFKDACQPLFGGLRHIRTRPSTPRANGEAERFIQTSLRERIYAAPYDSSARRAEAMIPWIDSHNTPRAH